MRRKQTSHNGRLSRDSWLQCALDVLRDEGIQGVRVERLARDLGVTKGSFYWHFEDRGELQRSILDYWSEKYTDVVVNNRWLLEVEPADGLLALMIQVQDKGLDRYELAMRAWAEHDSEALAAVRAVYEKRVKFVGSFFSRLGFRGYDADVRTRLALCYLSWEPNMFPNESDIRRRKMLRLQHEVLTRK